MATSLIGGLLKQGHTAAQDVYLFDPNAEQAQKVAADYKISLAADNQALVAACEVVVIAVKPQVLETVLRPLSQVFQDTKPLIISVVAGIKAQSIEAWLGDDFAVARVMPNTPALVGQGASGMYANSRVSEAQRSATETIVNAVGVGAWVNTEHDIDSVTALSGSGPAYFMLFIQGLIEAAERAGMDPNTAKTLAVQTAVGAAALVGNSELPLQTLIDNVTSPNGTTEQALKSFANDDLKGIVSNAFAAAKNRSAELADELG